MLGENIEVALVVERASDASGICRKKFGETKEGSDANREHDKPRAAAAAAASQNVDSRAGLGHSHSRHTCTRMDDLRQRCDRCLAGYLPSYATCCDALVTPAVRIYCDKRPNASQLAGFRLAKSACRPRALRVRTKTGHDANHSFPAAPIASRFSARALIRDMYAPAESRSSSVIAFFCQATANLKASS
jgi:hypothetical protein